jgi:hypothetical protein
MMLLHHVLLVACVGGCCADTTGTAVETARTAIAIVVIGFIGKTPAELLQRVYIFTQMNIMLL